MTINPNDKGEKIPRVVKMDDRVVITAEEPNERPRKPTDNPTFLVP